MRLKTLLSALAATSLWIATTAVAETDYAKRAGNSAGLFQSPALNYQLDLQSTPYKVVDFSKQVPSASFAAMRFDPLIFTMTIVENLGMEMPVEQYADIVATTTRTNFRNGTLDGDVEQIGEVTVDGVHAILLAFSGSVNDAHASYIVTAFVNGTMAYQLTTFTGGSDDEGLQQEAERVAAAFSFLGEALQPEATAKQVDAYKSKAFAYQLSADPDTWFPWAGLHDDYPFADTGALGSKGYGAAVLPYCWSGARPTQLAILDVMMKRFGEDYPSEFITSEEPVSRGKLAGIHLHGEDLAGDDLYSYHFWVVANERCAYAVSAWGPADLDGTEADLLAFWEYFSFDDAAGVLGADATDTEKARNAFFLNQTGMHYYNARSYREAYRYLAQATDLDPAEPTYLLNGLRALSDLNAYPEAYDWLQDRIARYPDNQVVNSWDAWLSYQVGDTEKAVQIYSRIFGDGYREDEEFGIFLGLLADQEQWDAVDESFDAYAGENLTDELRRLKASLLSRRGRYEEALQLLNSMSNGRVFSAELAYAKIGVFDAMEDAAGLLRQADLLIDNKYESLDSWFYKGYAEYLLRSYVKSRESFERAQKFSPGNSVVQEYIAAINGILGEGNNASISEELVAIALPKNIKKRLSKASLSGLREGYGAFFIDRISGFEFDGGKRVSRSHYQRIKIQDEQGIESFSTLEFNFDPAFEQLYVNSLVVRDENGKILAEADRNSFYVTDTVDGYEASTEKTAHLPVPSLAPGVVIDVVVTKRIVVNEGEMPLDIHYLAGGRPIAYSALFVTGNASKYHFDSFGLGKPEKSGKSQIWALDDPVVYRWEPMQPYYDRMLPWVTVGTTSVDWNVAGADYYAKIEEKLDIERVVDTARRLVRGLDDEQQKIDVLSRYVQKELHYEAIEFGRRAYIPKTARETLRDRYGDCKDHAVLLYSLLNAAGVPAELALVNLNQKVLPGLPNVDQFDHMIVSVLRNGKRIFIDATDKDFSLGSMPPRYMAGNSALLIGTASELVNIPDFEPGHSTLSVTRDVERIDRKEIRVREIGTFSGFQAAELRGQLRDIETSEMLATMQRWVADRYADAIVVDTFVDNLLDADSELIVELEYRLPMDDGDGFKLPGFFEAEYLDTSRLADRRFVFEAPVPFNVLAVTTIRQPAPAKLAVITNKPDADESRFANWNRKVDKSDESWVLRLEYSGRKSQFAPDDYKAYTDFHRRLIGTIEQSLVLQ